MNKSKAGISTTATALIAVASAILLSACGNQDVSFDTLEQARAQARSNGEYNAQLYRAESPRFNGHKIISHGDSTQSPSCPQGDGWATNTIMQVEGKAVEKFVVKCSTVSATLGCYLENDFMKKPFAAEEGKCQPVSKVPHPIPKMVK